MSDPRPLSSDRSTASGYREPSPAIFVLDARGRIHHANQAAGSSWQIEPAKLVGQAFTSLFAFEIVSQDPSWAEAQWEVLVASAVGGGVELNAQPFESAPQAVWVRVEASHGQEAGYFAWVTPKPARTTAALPPRAVGELDEGLALLAAKGPLGFFELNFHSGRVVYSPTWKRLLGYADQELPNNHDTWRQLIHPEDSAAAPDQVGRKVVTGARSFSLEFRMRHRRGHYLWIHSIGTQLFSAAGDLERVVGFHVDITERKEVEEQSLLNDERFLRLTEEGAVAAFDLDFNARQFWYSNAWHKLLGTADQPAAAGGIELFRQALPESATEDSLETFFLGPATGQTTFTRTMTLHRGDGGTQPVLLGVHRQLTRKRELVRVIGFVAPLPPRADAAPGASSDALPAALLEASFAPLSEAVIIADNHAAILFINDKAARLTGSTLTEARTQKLGDIFTLVHRVDGRPADDALDLVIASEDQPRLYTEHALLRVGDEAPLPIMWTVRQLWDASGQIAGVVVVFRDPEEMTLTPEELVRANRFDSLGQLAGGIAHDFNNLLTTILGGVSQAKENRDYQGLDDAEKACMAAKMLTRQLLAFAKGSAGAAQQVASPGEILRDAVRIGAAGSTAVITVETPDDLAPVQVDRGQMLQVFQNLIINALQAMPEQSKGQLRIAGANLVLDADEAPPLPAGRYVQIDVQDNGSGIAPENLEKIFDPFFTTKKHGTGLGLATVLSIVRKHGGQIGVSSTVGAGTTFTVFLPAAEKPLESEARRPAVLRFGTGRVLFMDDDPKICELTGGMLASLDYKYDIARTGEEAVQLYKRYLNIGRPYDTVIMDLTVIGGMGGEDTFSILRELDPDVRAIVCSGYDNDDMARRYLDMGFCGYLTKPYRVGDLGRVLKTVLG